MKMKMKKLRCFFDLDLANLPIFLSAQNFFSPKPDMI